MFIYVLEGESYDHNNILCRAHLEEERMKTQEMGMGVAMKTIPTDGKCAKCKLEFNVTAVLNKLNKIIEEG